MILTYKIKHDTNFTQQLCQAKKVAEFAIKNRDKLSSKFVAHIGLKSVISNQILRKYGKNKKIKKVSNIKLIIPNQGIKIKDTLILIPSLKISFAYSQYIRQPFSKINQIEIDNFYFYVSVDVKENKEFDPEGCIGIDRNTNGHCLVFANTKTNKVKMLGKKAKHIHTKYSKIRKTLQQRKKYLKLKTIKKRESNIVKDLNHKISSNVVKEAKETKCAIKLEYLKGIRNNKKQKQSFKYTLNSWSYYQLQTMIEYKAKLLGVPVFYIEPAYTSQTCHKCGRIGKRNDKSFKCPHCGYAAHADINASWNIANSEQFVTEPQPKHSSRLGSSSQYKEEVYSHKFSKEGDLEKGNTDIPQSAMALNTANQRTPTALA
ncbi:MAG: transposase [Phenylobacterium sp.]